MIITFSRWLVYIFDIFKTSVFIQRTVTRLLINTNCENVLFQPFILQKPFYDNLFIFKEINLKNLINNFVQHTLFHTLFSTITFSNFLKTKILFAWWRYFFDWRIQVSLQFFLTSWSLFWVFNNNWHVTVVVFSWGIKILCIIVNLVVATYTMIFVWNMKIFIFRTFGDFFKNISSSSRKHSICGNWSIYPLNIGKLCVGTYWFLFICY